MRCAGTIAVFPLRRPVTVLTVLAAATAAWAQEEAAPPSYDRIVAAYRNTSTYRATIRFQQDERQGRWEISRRTTFSVAFDRAARRLMTDDGFNVGVLYYGERQPFQPSLDGSGESVADLEREFVL